MKTPTLSLIALLSLASTNAFASGGFHCESQPEGEASSFTIDATVSWSFGLAIVGKPSFYSDVQKDSAELLNVSQYKNSAQEFYLLSVMDQADGTQQRIIELKTKKSGEYETAGTLEIKVPGENGYRILQKVRCQHE